MDEDILFSMYELKRHNILWAFVEHPHKVSSAVAYSYFNRVAPIFHPPTATPDGRDPFAPYYFVQRDFAQEVIRFIDARWMAGDLSGVGFYDLESHFGGHHQNRVQLIYLLEYARISRRFDDSLFGAVEANAPSEGNSIASSFTPDEVYFE